VSDSVSSPIGFCCYQLFDVKPRQFNKVSSSTSYDGKSAIKIGGALITLVDSSHMVFWFGQPQRPQPALSKYPLISIIEKGES